MSSSISKPRASVEPSKFAFDNSFDALAGVARSEGGLDIYTTEDLDDARAEGHREGHQAGRLEAQGETEHLTAVTLASIRESLAGLRQTQDRVFRAVTEDSAQLAVALIRKLARSLLKHRPLDEIEALLTDVLGRLSLEPRIVIWVADELLDPLNAQVGEIATAAGYDGKVVLLSKPQMAPGNCRIEWADGGAERLVERVEQEIDATIETLMSVGLETGADSDPNPSDIPQSNDAATSNV